MKTDEKQHQVCITDQKEFSGIENEM